MEKENITQLIQEFMQKKDWEGFLNQIESINKEQKSNEFIRIAAAAYSQMLDLPEYTHDLRVLRGLAFLHYSDYITCNSYKGEKNKALPETKRECEKKAEEYFKQILRQGRQPRDLYRYAHLLYKAACDFHTKEHFVYLYEKKDQSYELYDEAVYRMEKRGRERQTALYSRACYGLCRCGLDTLSLHSTLLDELLLLYKIHLTPYGSSDMHCHRFLRMCYCIEQVRITEVLPRVIDNFSTVVHTHQQYEKSWDIYHMLGKIFDSAYQYFLCKQREDAYKSAEKYYQYACEIDFIRRREHLPVSGFAHMYTALLTLYIRGREENKFYAAWEKYNPVIHFSEGFRILSQIRWLIIKKDYSEAEKVLTIYINCGKWQPGLSRNKAIVLLDIISAASTGKTNTLTGTYTSFQLKQLQHLKS